MKESAWRLRKNDWICLWSIFQNFPLSQFCKASEQNSGARLRTNGPLNRRPLKHRKSERIRKRNGLARPGPLVPGRTAIR